MSVEHTIYWIAFILWAVCVLQGLVVFWSGVRFVGYINRALAAAAGQQSADG
jgi:hypothetical protein